MAQILNLTQHDATPDQVAAGVVEPADKDAVRALLTFEELPTQMQIWQAAWSLAGIASAELGPWQNNSERLARRAMIGGAPFFMSALESALRYHSITPVYAFSKREATDTALPGGGVHKTQVFRHVGFVKAAP